MEIIESPAILEKEKKYILFNKWFFTGLRVDDISSKTGVVIEYLEEQVIVTKNDKGEINALLNVCPHRGTRLLRETQTAKNCITCPYHRWSFELDGKLRNAPQCKLEEVQGVSISTVKVGIWKEFIFLSFNHFVSDINEYFEPIERYVFSSHIENFSQKHATHCVIDSNWKLLHQNFSESYHSMFWHPELEDRSELGESLIGEDVLHQRGDHFSWGKVAAKYKSMSLSGKPYVNSHDKIMYFSIYPNCLCSLTCDYLFVQRFRPIDEKSTNVDCFFYADPCVDMKDVVDFWKLVFDQDREIVEMSQLGNKSRFFHQNHYTEHDVEVKAYTDRILLDLHDATFGTWRSENNA
jgi:phenylpropionate dioxygenase-like ring-hydroxylating dioxygenase large terminal subunit